jgi:hypothetical protein
MRDIVGKTVVYVYLLRYSHPVALGGHIAETGEKTVKSG